MLIATSKPIAESFTVATLLEEQCRWYKSFPQQASATGVVGWGKKASGQRAAAWAEANGLPCWYLEDGFIRSYAPGQASVGLSLVVDASGIYYDATRPCDLEVLLASETDLLAGIEDDIERAMALISDHGLSKYNHAPELAMSALRDSDQQRVLVVDQTHGDVSVSLGGADETTFSAMVEAALAENPLATVYIKTHPEVSGGAKQGYLSSWPEHPRIVMLRDAANPISLVKQMNKVYVVSSTLGFEALMEGKPVSVFGLPWYAGWGATDDRQRCERRTRKRSVKELFAAAYWHYTRYINPQTHQQGTIFDVIDWLVLQKHEEARLQGRIIGVGFRQWKAANLAPLFSLDAQQVMFVDDAEEAKALGLTCQDNLVAWGRDAPAGVDALAAETGACRWRLEDGFIRSVGLGAHKVAPLSIALDGEGIYFDPSQPSALERLLATTNFAERDCRRAREISQHIVDNRITKYNVEPQMTPPWAGSHQEVVFVPGQVEDDASIRYGTTVVSTNLALLKEARHAHPQAFIVYKPHPDVVYAKRKGALVTARQWADHIETECSVVSCLDHCDVVHTMTSLVGFEALLRGKQVVTYGEPFYAGWGLTEDRVTHGKALHRRQRRLTLDELVAGTLLYYPRYWDPVLKGYTTCEGVIKTIIAQRAEQAASGVKEPLALGFWQRQFRKWQIIRQRKKLK
ncbi:capsular polysaccharide biosynthesis protein [Vreelandella aquamarina]|uniref:capsular polysaccharide biosynthesis protein n=1 Tax=Vreelandella aquamarina TaxID=77097 RepID=UPI00384F013E